MTTAKTPATLGIDFGTSNSAAAYRLPGKTAALLPLEGAATGMPTALFFNTEEHSTHFGRDAMQQYLAGEEGRLMRSLKSLLGSSLLLEKTAVHEQLVSYQDIIAIFLKRVADQARQALDGRLPERVVLGRPVHFVDEHPQRDRQAQDALAAAARAAGLGEVSFQLEPIAAALDYEQRLSEEQLVLVVDIGGGTSDFTVVRLGPQQAGHADRTQDILATTGVHIGGTDFDHRLNVAQVMPLLGYKHIGPSGREVPSSVFFDLSTWHLIQWLYTAKALASARGLKSDYSDPQLHQRLMKVLDWREGHRLADAVEQAKIAASQSHAASVIALDWLEQDLPAAISPEVLQEQLQALLLQVVECAQDCVRQAGVAAPDAIYLTGGSSALRTLRDALRVAFPDVPQVEGDLFGGVATGLAYA
ncbi:MULTISPECIES: Hsp70 family protein [Comamonas]|uniref:Molecular chaperone Hsp70 n=1 Tax=Comamonas testosteroni TaxID=285 RepID=A0A096F8P3_COMTE|nr:MULTISPECIES: Hsp70 family protein [Comamonas]KGH26746.1 molecular chaperone Hsp70 [Comamonas testosteroni]MDN5506778.1 Hsp70 family protein [Comamonas sp.]MDN5537328.1 Hsp70 family protein [Comamonas sp.]MPT10321.1 Hsp70 family protein [Comamonas sp.]